MFCNCHHPFLGLRSGLQLHLDCERFEVYVSQDVLIPSFFETLRIKHSLSESLFLFCDARTPINCSFSQPDGLISCLAYISDLKFDAVEKLTSSSIVSNLSSICDLILPVVSMFFAREPGACISLLI